MEHEAQCFVTDLTDLAVPTKQALAVKVSREVLELLLKAHKEGRPASLRVRQDAPHEVGSGGIDRCKPSIPGALAELGGARRSF